MIIDTESRLRGLTPHSTLLRMVMLARQVKASVHDVMAKNIPNI
jgi:hypothetical protein